MVNNKSRISGEKKIQIYYKEYTSSVDFLDGLRGRSGSFPLVAAVRRAEAAAAAIFSLVIVVFCCKFFVQVLQNINLYMVLG